MCRTGRLPCAGGRRAVFTPQQEQEICNMVLSNNAITLREIQSAILEDNGIFQNINSVSISTIDRVLKRHQMTMKQLYKVPFERNCDRVKELRYQYVQVKQWCALHLVYCTVLWVFLHYGLYILTEYRPIYTSCREEHRTCLLYCNCMILQ